jgi:hypothetical protein
MLTQTIPSYLYQEYSDDEDLQAFVASFNGLAQQYVDFFNQINLPVYTSSLIVGALLDWVAEGLYGIIRQPLPSGTNRAQGPIGTFAFGTLPFGKYKLIGPATYYATSDDVFKRIITWHFYKGDGKVFNIRWLKRRIMRFLNGANGTDYNIDQTYQVSVSFGVGNQVNIRILPTVDTFISGSIGSIPFGTMAFGTSKLKITQLTPLQFAPVLQSAIESGAVELPFQYTYVVTV